MAAAPPGISPAPGAPVRRTLLGLERQGLGWTLAIGAVALVLAVGLPLADSVVSAGHASPAGSVTSVALGVRITPASGWSAVPQPAGQTGRAQLTRSGALLTITATAYPGSTRQAYDRLAAAIDAEDGVQISSDAETITTASGLVGIVSAFAASTEQGYFAAFTADGTLAVVIAESPLDAFHAVDEDFLGMIGSVEIRGSAP